MVAKLGIVAGAGETPRRVVDACQLQGREPVVLAFEGETDLQTVDGVAHIWTSFATISEGVARMREAGVRDLVIVGRIARPSLTALARDPLARRFVAKIGARAFTALGDDGLLRAVARDVVEAEGFRLIGAESVAHDLLAGAGPLGARVPDEDAWADIRRGIAVVDALGAVDVGQAAVIQRGQVLGVEAAEGTDGLLRRCAALAEPGAGGVLVKLAKPGQDRRLDLPTIGLPTVRHAADAGLAGVAVEAGGVFIVDRAAVIEAADAAGLFLIGVERD